MQDLYEKLRVRRANGLAIGYGRVHILRMERPVTIRPVAREMAQKSFALELLVLWHSSETVSFGGA
jgi:hypothetical protein